MCNPGARTTIAPSGNLLILLFIHHFVLLIIKETSCVSDHKRKVYNSQQPQEKLCWILSHYRNFLLSQQDYIFQSHTVIDLVEQQDHSSRNICISDSELVMGISDSTKFPSQYWGCQIIHTGFLLRRAFLDVSACYGFSHIYWCFWVILTLSEMQIFILEWSCCSTRSITVCDCRDMAFKY